MTDTHAHLDFLEPEELAEAAAHLPKLRAVLTLGVDPGRWEKTLSLAQGNVYAAVGLHPTSAHLLSPEVEEALRHYARSERVRAIGETGLDYYWTPETRAAQLKALDFQAALAEALGLPLVLHVRSKDGKAEEDLAAWLLLHRPKRAVLHAFSGHPALEAAGLEVGAYFSFAGPLTYRKNAALREAAARLPEDRLLVETDTPSFPRSPSGASGTAPTTCALPWRNSRKRGAFLRRGGGPHRPERPGMLWLAMRRFLVLLWLLSLALAAPRLVVEPEDGVKPLLDLIASAREEILVKMYLWTPSRMDVVEALGEAARRGVRVRVLLEREPSGGRVDPRSSRPLKRGGGGQAHHALPLRLRARKSLVVDRKRAWVGTMNLTGSSFAANREYALILDDPAQVAEIAKVFEADWEGERLDLSQALLVWAPSRVLGGVKEGNARETLLALIRGPKGSFSWSTRPWPTPRWRPP